MPAGYESLLYDIFLFIGSDWHHTRAEKVDCLGTVKCSILEINPVGKRNSKEEYNKNEFNL